MDCCGIWSSGGQVIESYEKVPGSSVDLVYWSIGLSIAYLPMRDLTLIAPVVTLVGIILFVIQLKLSKYEVESEDSSIKELL